MSYGPKSGWPKTTFLLLSEPSNMKKMKAKIRPTLLCGNTYSPHWLSINLKINYLESPRMAFLL